MLSGTQDLAPAELRTGGVMNSDASDFEEYEIEVVGIVPLQGDVAHWRISTARFEVFHTDSELVVAVAQRAAREHWRVKVSVVNDRVHAPVIKSMVLLDRHAEERRSTLGDIDPEDTPPGRLF